MAEIFPLFKLYKTQSFFQVNPNCVPGVEVVHMDPLPQVPNHSPSPVYQNLSPTRAVVSQAGITRFGPTEEVGIFYGNYFRAIRIEETPAGWMSIMVTPYFSLAIQEAEDLWAALGDLKKAESEVEAFRVIGRFRCERAGLSWG